MNKIYGRIAGWGSYLPEKVLTNFDLEKMVDTTDEWIVQRSGIRERRIAADHETTVTMGVEASKQALDQAQLDAAELDMIILATTTPDYLTPPASSQIQDILGAGNAPAFVVVTGCTGFVYSLTIAQQFIETGAYKNILVVGSELLSRFTNWQDRSTCVLFGDGAGAAVVQATDEPCGMFGFDLGSDGSLGQSIILPSGGSARPPDAEALHDGSHYVQMNGREVYKFATRVVDGSCQRALEKANMTMDDVDWIVPHQANIRIIQAAARNMGVPLDRFIITIDKYANTSVSTIPIALTEGIADGRIRMGDVLLLVAFGAGLTWSTAVVQMGKA